MNLSKAHLYSNLNILRWLLQASRGLRLQGSANALLGIIGVALDFAFIFATKLAIDAATGQAPARQLHWAALLLIGLTLLQLLLAYARRWMSQVLGTRAQNMMQRKLFARVLHGQWTGTQERHTGDLLNRLERDVRDITAILTETLPATLSVGVRFIGAFCFLFSMAPRLALLIILIAPLFILLSRLYVQRMRDITRQVRDTDSRIQSLMQESLSQSLILKTLEHEGRTLLHLGAEQDSLLGQVRRRTRFSALSNALISAGFATGYLVTFLWSASRLQQGLITYGMMIAFVQLAGQIQGPFRNMLRFVPAIVGAFTAGERLMQLEETPPETQGQPIRFPQGAAITLSNVSYTYPEGQRPILSHLNFQFPIGSRTAVLGETGAGKTTLVRLILSLIQPQEGTLTLSDGQRTQPISPQTRCNLVYVPQGNTLFSGTIRSNLLMGRPQATDEEMRQALTTACAEFVHQLPEGLDTPCGERGTGLSEGQMQRISIARALLRQGAILLLDEATSALDSDTEQRLIRNLDKWLQPHQSLIFITHRPAATALCQRTLSIQRNTQ